MSYEEQAVFGSRSKKADRLPFKDYLLFEALSEDKDFYHKLELGLKAEGPLGKHAYEMVTLD